MIDDPGCIGGKLISFRPHRGPEESQRRSLQIFESCTAARFIVAAICVKAPESCVASTKLAAFFRDNPVPSQRRSVTRSAYPGGLQIPVPMAVAPMLISYNSSTDRTSAAIAV